jgi:hypothetical protein
MARLDKFGVIKHDGTFLERLAPYFSTGDLLFQKFKKLVSHVGGGQLASKLDYLAGVPLVEQLQAGLRGVSSQV